MLAREDLIYGTEIGCWHYKAEPDASEAAIVSAITGAQMPVVRFSVYDIFTSWSGGNPWPAQFSGGSGKRPDGSNGTLSLANFQTALTHITADLDCILLFKLLPNGAGVNTGIEQRVFMPPLDNLARDVNIHKALLYEIRQVYGGPIIIESDNEGEYCAVSSGYPSTWRSTHGFTTDSAQYLSWNLGLKFAATMPALKKYARDTLGFSDVVTMGYVGLGGGAARSGSSYEADAGYDFGYHWTTTKQASLTEFVTACKTGGYSKNSGGTNQTLYDGYDAADDIDFIPDSVSIHDYSHGPNFVSDSPYECDDDLIYSYWRQWIKDGRANMRSICGNTIGDAILFSISEWSGGAANADGAWSGWETTATVEAMYDGWYEMLQGNGATTGSTSTRWWNNIVFMIASNNSHPASHYNLFDHNSPYTAVGWFHCIGDARVGDAYL